MSGTSPTEQSIHSKHIPTQDVNALHASLSIQEGATAGLRRRRRHGAGHVAHAGPGQEAELAFPAASARLPCMYSGRPMVDAALLVLVHRALSPVRLRPFFSGHPILMQLLDTEFVAKFASLAAVCTRASARGAKVASSLSAGAIHKVDVRTLSRMSSSAHGRLCAGPGPLSLRLKYRFQDRVQLDAPHLPLVYTTSGLQMRYVSPALAVPAAWARATDRVLPHLQPLRVGTADVLPCVDPHLRG